MTQMRDQNRAQFRAAVKSLPPVGGKRNFHQMVEICNTWARSKLVELGFRWKELDHKEFIAHWETRGRKEPEAEKKWKKATTPKKFRQKKALMHGKKMFAWVRLPRELSDKDQIAQTVSSSDGPSFLGGASAQKMLMGDKAPDLDVKQAFGGQGALMHVSESEDSDDDGDGSGSDNENKAAEATEAGEKKKKDGKSASKKDNKKKKKKKKSSSSSSSSSNSSESSSRSSGEAKVGGKTTVPGKGSCSSKYSNKQSKNIHFVFSEFALDDHSRQPVGTNKRIGNIYFVYSEFALDNQSSQPVPTNKRI